jgi:glycosidase
MKMGIGGFRLDVVDEIADELLDKISDRIKAEKGDALILGEVWEDAATKIAYDRRRKYFIENQLDAVMNYPLKDAIIDFCLNGNAERLASTFFMIQDHYPKNVRDNLMNFLGTHDTKRILSIFQDECGKKITQTAGGLEGVTSSNLSFNLLRIASAIQYCFTGVPAVFYGDEVGVTGGEAPFCRVCFPWGGENKEILSWYKKLGEFRNSHAVFDGGECQVLFYHNGVFVFERTNETERVIVAANCGREEFQLNLTKPMKDFTKNGRIVKEFVLLSPDSFAILYS